MSDNNTTVRELTLMLLYLTSWTEKERGSKEEYRRSWKGYPFDVINELVDADLIYGSRTAKSIYFAEDGEKEAKALLAKYGLSEE